ncbi:folate-binding protein YgfZ [Vreelandella rituensis]|uniref:Folate-binding protein n=1 Tax=Vreelandella rituensis TaxID=2282306 RepID=A0A368U109_9GAMM|nr:folate-binding protein YgfZ [Halomonas rituensis]RCV90735.1 folate-binding protein [Halomonas rituensis]
MSDPLAPPVFVSLSHLGILELKGKGAATLLQGQTSAQVAHANGNFAPLTCFCTAKGRVLANAQLWKVAEDHYRLMLSRDLLDSLLAHLKKFAAFYKVELRIAQEISLIGVIGEDAGHQMAQALEVSLPDISWHQAQSASQDAQMLRYPGLQPRWLACIPQAGIAALAAIPQASISQEESPWKLLDIQAGIAWVTSAQQDQFLPQMLNWEALGGISFKKGCYMGQEVVARAHFRGQVKKRLARAKVTTNTSIEPGTPVYDETGKSRGQVVVTAADVQGNIELLAVLATNAIEEELSLNIEGYPVSLLALPYPVERLDPETLVAH